MDENRLIITVLIVCIQVETGSLSPWEVSLAGCPEPSPVANSLRTWTVQQGTVTVTYTCISGYQLTAGSLTRVCHQNANGFVEDPPVCTLNCSKPRDIAATTNNATIFLADSVIGYTCIENYTIPRTVNSTVYCDPYTGQWEGDPRLMCRQELKMLAATAMQDPDPNASADLAVDDDRSTCSDTGVSNKATWSVGLDDIGGWYDVHSVSVALKLQQDIAMSEGFSLRVKVTEGLVDNCGKLNVSKASYSGDTLSGIIYCANIPSKPYGHNISITAFFTTTPASLQLCDVRVKGSPHTETCNFPPRIPRLKLVTEGRTLFHKLDTVRYVCAEPYTAVYGSGNVTCGHDSVWSEPSLLCTDDDNLINITVAPTGVITKKFWLEFDDMFEVSGVSINPAVEASIVVVSKGGNQKCSHVVHNETSLYVTCRYQPAGHKVKVIVPGSFDTQTATYKVFGRPFHSALECLQSETGIEYKGKINVTSNGHVCKPWTDNSLSHVFTADDFPDDTMESASNFCRNPENSQIQPWCYVDSPTRSWETCTLYQCDQLCKVKADGTDYKGPEYFTQNGEQCLTWAAIGQPFIRPKEFSDLDVDQQKCRNPAGSQSTPWCFVKTKPNDTNIEGVIEGTELVYDLCDIPQCPTSVDIVSIQQSRAWLGLEGTANDEDIRDSECYRGGMWTYSPSSWVELTGVVCEGAGEDDNRTVLCRSVVTRLWRFFVVLCDGQATLTTTPSLVPSASSDTPQSSASDSLSSTILPFPASDTSSSDSVSSTTLQSLFSALQGSSSFSLDSSVLETSSLEELQTSSSEDLTLSSWTEETISLSVTEVMASSDVWTVQSSSGSILRTPSPVEVSSSVDFAEWTSSVLTLQSTSPQCCSEYPTTTHHPVSTQSVSPHVTTTSSSPQNVTSNGGCQQICNCRVFRRSNVTAVVDSEMVDSLTSSIQKELTVDTQNLSRTIRKKISATDNRPSAVTVGSMGVVLLTGTFLLITASDVFDAFFRSRQLAQAENKPSDTK